MRRYKSAILLFSILALLLVTGCWSGKQKAEFEQLAIDCVESHEDVLLELFDILKNNYIYQIKEFDRKDDEDIGFVIKYNDREIYIILDSSADATLYDEGYRQACEIFDFLLSRYPVSKINCLVNKDMYVYFEERYLLVDWGIAYYPLEASTPESDEYDVYLNIKDGFYIYYYYPGF
ncbi:MAG: hypothetical protein ACOYJD_01210 [Christensenellales bacterium]|jgi:hypothetical protein